MNVKPLLLASVLLAVAMAGFAFWAAGQMPPGAQLPTHWNAAGEVDGSMPALTALLIAPGITLIIGLIFAAVPAIEPLQDRLEGSEAVLRTSWIGTLALMALLQGVIAAPVFGIEAPHNWVLVAVGLLLVALGNVLPKSRPGFFVGIRTPWTLIDTDNWIATHRLGGKLFMLAGAAIVAAALIDIPGEARMAVVLAGTLIAALVPFAYSWWLWREGTRRAR